MMMNKIFYLLLLCPIFLFGQKGKAPEFNISKASVEMKLRFLASDELKGRYTGSEGNNIAARYIAEHLRAFGFQPAPGQDSYFQQIDFKKTQTPSAGFLKGEGEAYEQKGNLFFLSGNVEEIEAQAVFAKYGWIDEENGRDDYEGLDVKGKIVFVLPGTQEDQGDQQAFGVSPAKRKIAEEKGALALIELYRLQFQWGFFKQYFGRSSLRLPTEEEIAGEQTSSKIVYGWLKEKPGKSLTKNIVAGETPTLTIMSSGYAAQTLPSNNVVGILEGTDPKLKNEYILMSAHFDHVGVGQQGGGATTKKDSIFNGARDNAMGTVALLTAAEALSIERPKRSIIFLACTAEEVGLLGSQYYAAHPLIPLDQTIFNANSDGAGYTTTSEVAIIGWGRTGTDYAFTKGAESVGLGIIEDPAKEQGLFDRSDNLSFTRKGVPAATISPGFATFDQELMKNYHQVSDEAETVDMEYLLKFAQAYTQIVRIIANNKEKPQWIKGDKYEAVGKELYKK